MDFALPFAAVLRKEYTPTLVSLYQIEESVDEKNSPRRCAAVAAGFPSITGRAIAGQTQPAQGRRKTADASGIDPAGGQTTGGDARGKRPVALRRRGQDQGPTAGRL